MGRDELPLLGRMSLYHGDTMTSCVLQRESLPFSSCSAILSPTYAGNDIEKFVPADNS